MPIYEYVCAVCANEWSDLVAASSSPAPPCPSCGAKRAEKKFSVFASAGTFGGAAPARGGGGGGHSCGPGSCGCGRFN